MIITWISIWLFIATIAFIRIYYIISTLVDKINKQQEQIRILGESTIELGSQDIKLVQLANHMTQASKDIATKVVDIEKRVDELEFLLDFYSQMIERNRISIADIEYQLKNSDFNGN